MFPIMYLNDLRIRELQGQLAGIEAQIGRLFEIINSINISTTAQIITAGSSPQGVVDALVPMICLVPDGFGGFQIYSNSGTGINGWSS